MHVHMHDMHLRDLDLNLLVVFDSLLEERSVSAAAKRLGLSQSATSHALQRLRAQFDDPLFVRVKSGMVPTPRAEQIAAPLRRGMNELNEAVRGGAAFDPRTSRRTFRIATVDYPQLSIIPKLMRQWTKIAPRVTLEFVPLAPNAELALESGAIDLIVDACCYDGPGLMRQKLFDETYASATRRDHPKVKRKMDLDLFLALPHVVVAPGGERGGLVHSVLDAMGLERHVQLTVPNFVGATWIAAHTDMVITAPRAILTAAQKRLPLRIHTTPLELPEVSVHQTWHSRYQGDDAHIWLRRMIGKSCKPGH